MGRARCGSAAWRECTTKGLVVEGAASSALEREARQSVPLHGDATNLSCTRVGVVRPAIDAGR